MTNDKVYIHEDGLLEAMLTKASNKVVTEEMKKKASTPSKSHKPEEKKDDRH